MSLRLSVILPVRNEIRSLPALLASLFEQRFPADEFEILVADGRSTDGTREYVERVAADAPVPLRLVDNAGIRSGAGRNAGIRAARGEFIVFIDGHCTLPSRTLLRDTIALFEETGADCLCRPQPLVAPGASPTGEAIAAARASTLGHGRDSLIYDMGFAGCVNPASSGASYRREVFSRTGLYDESFDACEDVELNTRVHKLGMKAYTDPRLAVYYAPRATLSGLARQMLRYGRGRTRLARKHPDAIARTQYAPVLLLALWGAALAALAFMAVSGRATWWAALPLAALGLYGLAVMAASAQLALRRGPRLAWKAPLIYPVIHLGLAVGMLAEILAPERGRPRAEKRGASPGEPAGGGADRQTEPS